jgi:hypothetical protein
LTNFFAPYTNIQIVISDFEEEVETKDVETKSFSTWGIDRFLIMIDPRRLFWSIWTYSISYTCYWSYQGTFN